MSPKCGISESQNNFPWPTVEGKAWQLGFLTEQNRLPEGERQGPFFSHFWELLVQKGLTWRPIVGLSAQENLSWSRKGAHSSQSSASATSDGSASGPHRVPLEEPQALSSTLLSVIHRTTGADLIPSANI